MGDTTARQRAIEAAASYTTVPVLEASTPGEIFGINVFSKPEMLRRLPKSVYTSVLATIEHSEPLDPTIPLADLRAGRVCYGEKIVFEKLDFRVTVGQHTLIRRMLKA